MTVKRIGGILCFVLVPFLLMAGIKVVSRGPALADLSGQGFGQAVGAFLPTVAVLIAGLWLFRKPK